MDAPLPMIEYVQKDGVLLAVVVPPGLIEGAESRFVTEPHHFFQCGVLSWSAGRIVEPHWHPPRTRIVGATQEALFVRRGEIRVEFYDDERRYVTFRRIRAGSVLLLLSGGHGMRALVDSEVIEVKQGPYDPERDKIRFLPQETP